MVPIKHRAKILGVVFVGSSIQQSFDHSSVAALERLSHAIGEILGMLEDKCQLVTTCNKIVDFSRAINYVHYDTRDGVRMVLRRFARTVRRHGELDKEEIRCRRESLESQKKLRK